MIIGIIHNIHHDRKVCGTISRKLRANILERNQGKKYFSDIRIKSYAKQNLFLNVFKSLLIFTKYANIDLYIIC